jgi:hypothetical protein
VLGVARRNDHLGGLRDGGNESVVESHQRYHLRVSVDGDPDPELTDS